MRGPNELAELVGVGARLYVARRALQHFSI